MKKKIVFVLVILIMLTAGMYPVIFKNNSNKGINLESSNELEVYLVQGDNVQKRLVEKYKKTYPDVKVNEIVFDSYEEYSQRFNSEVLAGKGPDIVFVENGGLERLYKLLESGVFVDLQTIIDQDEEFNLDNYNSVVMDSGIYNKKRYIIPFNYSQQGYIYIKDNLDEYNVNLSSNENINELINLFTVYFDSKKYETEEQFFMVLNDCNNIYDYQKMSVIKNNYKDIDFNNENFIDMVEVYKNITLSLASESEYQKYNYNDLDMLLANKALFTSIRLEPTYFYCWYNYVNTQSNSRVEFLDNIEEGLASTNYYMAINSNSKNKKEAYDFIKLGLSEDYQKDFNNHNDQGYLPVNKEALNYLLKKAEDSIGGLLGGRIMKDLPIDVKEKYKNSLFSVKRCIIRDVTIDEIVTEEIYKYYQEECSIEDAINEINRKVKIYFNE